MIFFWTLLNPILYMVDNCSAIVMDAINWQFCELVVFNMKKFLGKSFLDFFENYRWKIQFIFKLDIMFHQCDMTSQRIISNCRKYQEKLKTVYYVKECMKFLWSLSAVFFWKLCCNICMEIENFWRNYVRVDYFKKRFL